MKTTHDRATILAVDDTQANLHLLSVMLNSAGYLVKTASNGRSALMAAKNAAPELILLDIDMPDMSGYEVCRKLKADETLKHIPVLFISALSFMADKIEAFQAGGIDYITKPFQTEEVLARVQTHLKIRRYQMALTEKSNILQETIDDLKKAQRSLIQAEKMASLGVLTAGIAHEINNPINFIKTSVYALKQDMGDVQRLLEAFEENDIDNPDTSLVERIIAIKSDINYDILVGELPVLVNNITMGVDRTEAVVNSLRTYSRPDEDEMRPAVLSDLIDTALVLLQGRYKKKIEIKKDINNIHPVSVQSGRLLQVLINVIGNAIDAVEEEHQKDPPVIRIQARTKTDRGNKYAVVQILDNGPGIDDALLDKVFDPFFTTKEVGKGVGLGMSISYGIIRDHGGRIKINSGKETGTTVSIFLPLEGKKR